METGVITADSDGIRRLLEFLSHSFGGGTDVTGALKFAITALESDDKEKRIGGGSISSNLGKDFAMEAADILLVTDGEIPDPPVPHEVMESIDRLKLLKGVEIHGLLVGKSESKPLSRVCSHTHDFLSRYNIPATMNAGFTAQTSPLNSVRQKGRASATKLYAKRSYYDDDDGYRQKGKKGNQKWDRSDEEDEDHPDSWTAFSDERNIEEEDETIQDKTERLLVADDDPRRMDEKQNPLGVGTYCLCY